MRLKRNRIDLLDLVFVVGVLIVVGGRLIERVSDEIAGLVVGGIGGVLVFAIVVFTGWWDLEESDYRGQEPAVGMWTLVRVQLPGALLLAGAAVLTLSVIRIGWGDVEWFTRYVMGAFWAITGLIGIGHGWIRLRLRRSTAGAARPSES